MSDSEELFDVVNENDVVVGCLPRSEVHATNLLHRSIHTIVINDRNEVFLQLRGPDRDNNPSLWDTSVAGHLHSGEDYDHAAIREIGEEIGIKLDQPPEKLFKLKGCKETDYEFCWIYRLHRNGPFKLDPEEAVDGKWVSPRELNRWIQQSPQDLTGSFRLIWKKYLEENPHCE